MRTWTNPVKNVAWIVTLQSVPATKPASSAVTKPTAASATAPVASSASGPAVDCNDRKNRNENAACKSAFKENTLGTGPHLFDQPGLSQDWANGYVDVSGSRLIVGGLWGDGDEKLGALISVDMSSGNRRVISGAAVSDGAPTGRKAQPARRQSARASSCTPVRSRPIRAATSTCSAERRAAAQASSRSRPTERSARW